MVQKNRILQHCVYSGTYIVTGRTSPLLQRSPLSFVTARFYLIWLMAGLFVLRSLKFNKSDSNLSSPVQTKVRGWIITSYLTSRSHKSLFFCICIAPLFRLFMTFGNSTADDTNKVLIAHRLLDQFILQYFFAIHVARTFLYILYYTSRKKTIR